jgi:Calx-beta domain/SdrD B-like domain
VQVPDPYNASLSGGAHHHSDPINFSWNTSLAAFDSIGPSISSASVTPTSVSQDGRLTINFRAADNTGGSGLDHFGFFLERNGTSFNTRGYVAGLAPSETDGRLLHGAAIYDPNATSYTWTVPANLPTGVNYRVRIVAVDKANNYSSYAYTNTFSVTAQGGSMPRIQINDPSVPEGNPGTSTANFNVSLSAATIQAITIQYHTVDGSARANVDYLPVSNGTLTIPAGQTAGSIPIQIIGNRTPEPDKTFDVELLTVTTGNALLDDRVGRCTIANDDQPARLGVRIDGTQVTEGDSGTVNAIFHVSLSEPATQPVSVGWTTANGTAVAGSDYVAASGTLNFAVGEKDKDITVAVNGDTVVEATEVFYVRLLNPSPGLSIDNVSGTGTILDNDRPGVAIVNSPAVIEGNSGSRNADFLVRLSAASTQVVTVDYTTQAGTAQAGTDYSTRSSTLTFNPGVTEQTVSVPVLGDTTVEPDETFALVLSNPSNALITGGAGSAIATIVNDDRATLPLVSVIGTTVNEGNTGTTTATVTVRLSAPSSQPVSVYCQTEDGTARDGSDYQASGGPITFNANETSKTFTITILNDTVPEGDEYFRVRLSNPNGAFLAGDTAQVIIRDNDVPTIVLTDQSFIEGTGGNTSATFSVTLSAASTQTVKVDYRTATEGTATSGVDYLPAAGTLTFNPGQTSKTLTVTVVGDAQHEADEKFYVDFTNPVYANLGSKTYAAGTILDDDAPALPSLTVNDVSVTEGNSGTTSATFTVTLSAVSGQTVTVDYATADGSATAGSDYVAGGGTLSFSPGQTSKTITVTVNGDTTAEATEDFFVNLFNPSSNATLADATGRGTIINDDTPAPPSLSIDDVTVTEGDTGPAFAIFTVTLSAASSQQVIVNFASQDGTATDGSDYIGVLGGLTLNPGQMVQTIVVQVNGDVAVEGDETFFVQLSSPVNATIAQGNGHGTITDDDFRNLPSLTVEGSSVGEGNSGTRDLFFTVRLSRPSDLPVTVDYATADGTAVAGSDYVAAAGGLTFIPGETAKAVWVSVLGDTANEADETFTLNLLNPGNAILLTATATGTIANDDGGGGTIQGRVFNDLNADGVGQAEEPGRGGVTVYLDLNRNGQLDSGEPTATTAADGTYQFIGLAAGNYQVRQLGQAGWSQTLPCGPPGLHQVTDNNVFFDINPQTDDCQVVWQEQYSNGTTDIWLQDSSGRRKLTDFPLPTTGVGPPQIDNGQIVFSLTSGTNPQVFLRTGGNTVQLTNNSSSNERPQIDRGQVVWMAYNGSTGLYDVFLYDGLTTRQVSANDGVDDYNPQIDAGRIVWQHGFNDASDIMYFDGANTIRLTNNSYPDQAPQIDAGQVVWQGWDGHDWEIFLYNGTSVVQLTNNDYDDLTPRISSGQVTWQGKVDGADSETFFYDGVTVQQLTNNTWSDSGQQINNGRVVWTSYDPATGGQNVFLYDGLTTVNISNRANNDFAPQISGNKVVWYGWDGSDYEIFEYVLTDAQAVQLRAGRTVAGVDFGTYRLQTVSGMKFNDLNGDGVHEDGEPGLAGWTVQFDVGGDGTVDRTATTDANGAYAFADIAAGSYRVSAVPQASWMSTTSEAVSDQDTGEAGGGDLDFGTFLPPTLSGQVFNDLNHNGIKDAGESGLAGWTVQLDLNNDGTVDGTTTTDPGGNYSFVDVGPGTYRISQVLPAGWGWSAPAPNFYVITAVSGQAVGGEDFGDFNNVDPYTVTNTNDSGPGSLRQAILNANAHPGLDMISFSIGIGGQTIGPASALPVITDSVIIDGTSQPGFAGLPLIELNGSQVTSGDGLRIAASNGLVRGLVINRFGWNGIAIDGGSNNSIAGNYLGTDASGTQALGNGNFGVALFNGAKFNHVGTNGDGVGDAGEGNVISGNLWSGVGVVGTGTDSNTVAGNYIGTNASGTTTLGNGNNGVAIYGRAKSNRIGTDGNGTADAAERNVIAGNTWEGVSIANPGTSGNLVAGNYIGTNPQGAAAIGNHLRGIAIFDRATGNRIGTDGNGTADDAERNVVSGNALDGVLITDSGTTGNVVAGNYIGLNAQGTGTVGNGAHGVAIVGAASSNRVGTDGSGSFDVNERNVIAGNGFDGVLLEGTGVTNNVVSGNYIGTDKTGSVALGGNHFGVKINAGAATNRVGTNGDGIADDAERNVLSGNLWDGVFIGGTGSDSNVVAGNYIGVSADGTKALGNNFGVRIDAGARFNRIGTDPLRPANSAERNVISGNRNDGVLLIAATTASNSVAGNFIGTDATGTATLGNAWSGVSIDDGASDNTIGGWGVSTGNTIAYNGIDGVAVLSGTGNAILADSIFANGQLGIDLGAGGVTPNDPGDGDAGANNLQNFPVLTSAGVPNGSTTIRGTLDSTPNTNFRVEFFDSAAGDPSGYGEGQTFLGAMTVTTDASGSGTFMVSFPVAVPGGYVVTATATDPGNNTSEFSAAAAVDATPPTADVVDVTPDPRTTPVTAITIVFSEAVTGFDLADLSLTRGGSPVSLAGASLTTTDHVTWTLGSLSGLTGALGNYVLTLTAAGSGITDAAGNPLAADASDSWAVVAPPAVQSVMVNDGDVQRSMVTSLAVTFSEVVTLAPGAFELRDAAGNLVPATITVTTQVVGGHTLAVLTFGGTGVLGGSLADGRYTLTVRADRVTTAAGPMAADYVFAFYRLFGDGTGDGVVDVDDLLAFASAYGTGSGGPGYLWYFDYNADGVIDVDDLLAFADRYGTGI